MTPTLIGILLRGGGGTGTGMSAATYDPTSVSADAFNTKNHSDTNATINSNTSLVAKKIYCNDSASNLIHPLPAADAVGKWAFIFKKGTGNIRLNRAGSDTLVDASSTYIENTTAGDAGTAYLCLYVYTVGVWSIRDIMNTWSYA